MTYSQHGQADTLSQCMSVTLEESSESGDASKHYADQDIHTGQSCQQACMQLQILASMKGKRLGALAIDHCP